MLFSNRFKGVIIIETVFTLPILCYLIFFILELMKTNIAQTAIDTITAEATFEFIANGTIKNFEKIIDKYRPEFIPKNKINYWFRLYQNLEAMYSQSPYGGEGITYPNGDTSHAGFNSSAVTEFIDVDNNKTFLSTNQNIIGNTTVIDYINNGTPSRIAFILTFVCDYPFSSSFVKVFFSGGSNTIKNDTKGTKYILWARGAGIVN